MVLSHGLWQRAFGGDRNVLGKVYEVNGTTRTIIGVMPQGFDVHDEKVEAWLPLQLDPANPRSRGGHFVYAASGRPLLLPNG